MKKRSKKLLSVLSRFPCLLLATCTVGPDYHRAPATVTPAFKEQPGWKLAEPRDAAPKGNWWQVYGDTELNRLEGLVEGGNQTVREQVAAYENARALVNEARAALFPTLSANAGVTRNSGGGGSSSSATSGSRGTTRTQYSVEATTSWDLDLWGKIRRQVESQAAGAQASAALLANARLSAQALLATNYLDVRVSDALRRVLEETVRLDREALRIAQNQYDAGFVARSDVLTAQTQLEAAQSASINVGVARAQYEHAIAVLLGVPPASFALAAAPSVPGVPDVPGVVPAALLERRPDVAAAERTMQADNALIGVNVAAYYPVITLSALFGYAGDPLGSLISSGNRLWSLGASASDAIFQGGARSAAVGAARATYEQSVAAYRQTVLTAFQQVEDALSGLRILGQQELVQQRVVADAHRAAQIALNEYRAGTVAYTAVISAQNTLLNAQQTEISIQQTRLANSVALIEALGGGWQAVDLYPKP